MQQDTTTPMLAFVGGGLAGFAAGRWLVDRWLARGAPASSPKPAPTPPRASTPMTNPSTSQATPSHHAPRAPTAPKKTRPDDNGPITSPDQIDASEPVSSPSQIDAVPRPSNDGPALPSNYDTIFDRYRGDIPIEFLRALAQRESGFDPAESSGPAWGLMQIIEVVRADYNRRHKTSYRREDLLDPSVSVAMCCWVLQRIATSYQKNHPNVPNLQPDWNNPRFVELLTFGWNAGFSEAGGVGRVARFLEARGDTDLTIDKIHAHAAEAGASRHLASDAKVHWCKSVVALYERERTRAATSARNGSDDPRELRVTIDGDRIDVTGQGSATRRWRELMIALANARGFVKGPSGHVSPNTSIRDIQQVIDLWNEWIGQVPDAMPSDALGAMAARSEWAQATDKVATAASEHSPSDVYADNDAFWWHDLRTLAEYIDASLATAPAWYERVADAASVPIDYAAEGAKDLFVGAKRAFTGALDVLLKSLLIGAAILGAGLLLVVGVTRSN